MSIIFYEYGYCEKILKKGVKKLFQRDLNYLAKYWEYKGESYENIQKNIEVFCIRNNEDFNVIQSSEMIYRALTHAKNNYLRFPTPIIITQAEVNTIRSLDDYRKEKFLFIMLLCAKYFKTHKSTKHPKRSKFDNTLYSNSSIKYIKEIARVEFTRKEWKELKHELTIKGLISPTIFGSNYWAVGFRNENSEPCFIINDYRNIIAYYQEYCGEVMVDCENCGVRTSKKSYRHDLCRICFQEKRKEKINNNAKKYYTKRFLYKEK